MAALPENDRFVGPFLATAGQTDFPADFPLIRLDGLRVRVRRTGELDQVIQPPDVSAVAVVSEAFTARLAAPMTGGEQVFVYSDLPPARQRAHTPGGAVRTETLEADAREFQAQIQEQRRELAATFRVPPGDEPLTPEQVREASLLAQEKADRTGGNLSPQNARAFRGRLQLLFVTPEDFGYSDDSTLAQNDAALTAFFAALSPVIGGKLKQREYEFSTAKVKTGAFIHLDGEGRGLSTFVYKGAATNLDMLTFGGVSPSVPATGVCLHGFDVRSETTMTGGHMIVLQNTYSGSIVTEVSADEYGYRNQTFKGWHGIYFKNVNVCSYIGFASGYMQGDAVRVSGQAGADTGSDLIIDDGTIVGCAGAGIRLGGGFGGLYTGKIVCFANRENMVIDTTLVARLNREVFIGEHTVFDGGFINNLRIDDALSGGSSITMHGFIGSAGLNPLTGLPRPEAEFTGDNIRVDNWNGTLTIKPDKLFNAKRHGLLVNTANTVVAIPDTTLITNNGGHGIFASVPTSNIHCAARFGVNTGGNFNANSGIGAWTSQAITIGAGSGAIAAYTAVQRSRELTPGTFAVEVEINITDNGTGANNLLVFTAFNAAQKFAVSGFSENGFNGLAGLCLIDDGFPGIINLVKAAGGYPGAGKITLSGIIRRAV